MTAEVQHRTLTAESWEDLFDFLDPDRRDKPGPDRDGVAILRCAEIRRKLECFFASRRCADAEDLAMETTLRVAAKCRDLYEFPTADRIGYFYAVARNVLHEWVRASRRESITRDSVMRDPTVLPGLRSSPPANAETAYRCLERCMTGLPQKSKRLIVAYYDTQSRNKSQCHRDLADEFGTSPNGLRIKVYRVRKALRDCVLDCVRSQMTSRLRSQPATDTQPVAMDMEI